MDFELTEEQRMFQETARQFADKEIAPIAEKVDELGQFPHETILKLGELGFMGIGVPQEYGGAGADAVCYVVALEEISRACASHGVIMSVNNRSATHLAVRHGGAEAALPRQAGGRPPAVSLERTQHEQRHDNKKRQHGRTALVSECQEFLICGKGGLHIVLPPSTRKSRDLHLVVERGRRPAVARQKPGIGAAVAPGQR
jgi:hypothetical protein